MSSLFRFCTALCFLAPTFAHSAVLENPSGGNPYSGVGVVSGWKCDANGLLTVRFYDAAIRQRRRRRGPKIVLRRGDSGDHLAGRAMNSRKACMVASC